MTSAPTTTERGHQGRAVGEASQSSSLGPAACPIAWFLSLHLRSTTDIKYLRSTTYVNLDLLRRGRGRGWGLGGFESAGRAAQHSAGRTGETDGTPPRTKASLLWQLHSKPCRDLFNTDESSSPLFFVQARQAVAAHSDGSVGADSASSQQRCRAACLPAEECGYPAIQVSCQRRGCQITAGRQHARSRCAALPCVRCTPVKQHRRQSTVRAPECWRTWTLKDGCGFERHGQQQQQHQQRLRPRASPFSPPCRHFFLVRSRPQALPTHTHKHHTHQTTPQLRQAAAAGVGARSGGAAPVDVRHQQPHQAAPERGHHRSRGPRQDHPHRRHHQGLWRAGAGRQQQLVDRSSP